MGGLIGSSKAFAVLLQDLLKDDSILLNKNSKALLLTEALSNSNTKLEMTYGFHVKSNEGIESFLRKGAALAFTVNSGFTQRKNLLRL